MKTLSLLTLLLFLSTNALAKGKMIYSVGGGRWGLEHSNQLSPGNKNLIGEYNTDIFVRVGNEKNYGRFFLHSLSLGAFYTKAQAQYNYEVNSTSINDLNTEITTIEGRLGFKFVPLPIFYLGGGLLLGEWILNYEDHEYKLQGGTSVNEKLKEAQLSYGYYYEVGLAIAFKKVGIRAGMEISQSHTQRFETLGNTKLVFDAKKLYAEVFWTM